MCMDVFNNLERHSDRVGRGYDLESDTFGFEYWLHLWFNMGSLMLMYNLE